MAEGKFAITETSEFNAFYRAYPRHDARADAWKAWQQTRGARPPLGALVAAVEAAAVANEWTAGRRRFIPLPASWLRGERWLDEFEVPSPHAPPLPAPDPAEVERCERERLQVMRARAGWSDITAALRVRSLPLGGWTDARIAVALDAIGGFARVCRVRSRAELDDLGLAFVRTWLSAAVEPIPARLQLVRRA